MKKWLKWLVVPACLLTFSLANAADTTRSVSWYSTYGYSAGEMIRDVMHRSDRDDSIITTGLTAIFAAGNTNSTKAQLERRVMSVPITMSSTGEDTVWTTLFAVPSGKTMTVTSIMLTARTEVEGNNDSSWSAILYHNWQGDTLLVLDTAVAQFATDADSIAYDDTTYTLSLTDSVFTAGEIVQWWQMNYEDAATGGEGAACVIEYLIDE